MNLFVWYFVEILCAYMEPSTWGPHVWSAIHLICLGAPVLLPDAEQEHYQKFFNYLALVIPCTTCRQHLKENMRHISIAKYLSGRDKLFEWSVLIHNRVNASLGEREWTLDEAKKHWNKIASGELCETPQCKNKFNAVLGLVVLVAVVGSATWFIAGAHRRK